MQRQEERVEAAEEKPVHKEKKEAMVVMPNTCGHPWAMMVHAQDATAADVTMMAARRLSALAGLAKAREALPPRRRYLCTYFSLIDVRIWRLARVCKDGHEMVIVNIE